MVGCGSFKTTALYRHANDSVSVQKTNRKLKGLPVKLKVPSHVNVTVYEQQVILANSASATAEKIKDSKDAAALVVAQQSRIKGIETAVSKAQQMLQSLKQAETTIRESIRTTDLNDTVALKARTAGLTANIKEQTRALAEDMGNAIADEHTLPAERAQLDSLRGAASVAVSDVTIKYTMISFNPAQYVVETELQYTDKVFLVDFKRPAGGVLNLKEASMDDEQYFSKIQAEVEERTLSDIGSALDTIKDPLSSLAKRNKNTAVPTSAGTPEGESNNTVNFQKSVVATKRFDISEPAWEDRLQNFVNEYIQATQAVVRAPINHSPQQPVHPSYGYGEMQLQRTKLESGQE